MGFCCVDVNLDGRLDRGVVDGIWIEGSVVVLIIKIYFNYDLDFMNYI